jgi:DNA polymerase III subunit gamma/tau
VHMLSKNAFNALLKTLEEPPPDVKFVFATTEVNKVPVTVLSRCQRFSLRRVPIELLSAHYQRIAGEEGVAIEPAALGLIARAADGSVRDGLSLLDQAIALADGAVGETLVRDMLGIADRGLVCDLFETVLHGDAAAALGQMASLYRGGADPLMVLQDLLDFCHFVTRLKLVPEAGADDPMEAGDRGRGVPLAERLAMPVLTRAWQMLLKGIEEVQSAPSPEQAAEMVLVRLAYASDLPVPADLIRSLDGGGSVATRAVSPAPAPAPRPVPVMPPPTGGPVASAATAPVLAPDPAPVPTASAALDPMPMDFTAVIALFDAHREAVTRAQLWAQLHLVAFEPGRIEFRPAEGAPRDLASRLSQCLSEWTGTRWVVAVSQAEGAPTLQQQEERRDRALKSEVAMDPLVRAALDAFPGATIAAVRERLAGAEPGIEPDGEAGDDDANSAEDEG